MAIVRRLTAVCLALALAAGTAVMLASPAQAADNGDWAAFPERPEQNQFTPRQYFFFDVAPGTTIRDAAEIQNSLTRPLRLFLYGADAFNVTSGGGFALKEADEEMTDVGSWVNSSRDEIIIPAARERRVNGETRLVPGKRTVDFSLTVPESASPGDHAGGFVTIEPEPSSTTNQGGVNVGVQRALGVRIYVRVSGPLNPQLLVTDVRYTKLDPATMPFLGDRGIGRIEYTYVNDGNQRITPITTITYNGLFGRNLHTIGPKPNPEILPGETITLTDEVIGMPVLDQVTAKVSMEADTTTDRTLEGVTAAGTTSGFVVSWIFVGVVVLLVIGFFVWRRYRNRTVEVEVTTAPAPVAAS